MLAASLIGLVSGVGGLLAGGTLGKLSLRIIAVVALGYVLVGLVNRYLLQERRRLRAQAAALRDEFAEYRAAKDAEWGRYIGAVERLVDRQSLQYTESLEITLVIGADSDGDRVVERRVITPTPYLSFRSLRPVIPQDTLVPLTFDDLDLRVAFDDPDNVRATLVPLAERASEIRILIVFDPEVREQFAWTLSYRSRGLFDTLREQGVDRIFWDARSPLGLRDAGTFEDFRVKFVFPDGAHGAIEEDGVRGVTTHPRVGEVPFVVEWHDPTPEGERYVWDVTLQT
ncbi:hypothetical protein ACIB24_00195 [Spongisporangium articulatum]|uniref:Uncharacterized protein n=1 Tax=Spongisporangium articulatum TaxID=3362603 RepID=A0ABW8AGK7_9ACTN